MTQDFNKDSAASITGSNVGRGARQMHQSFQDSLAIVIMAEDFAHQQSIARKLMTVCHTWLLAQVANDTSSHLPSQQNQSWD